MFYCFGFLILYSLESPPPPPPPPTPHPSLSASSGPTGYRIIIIGDKNENNMYFLLTASGVLFSQDVNMFLVTSQKNKTNVCIENTVDLSNLQVVFLA